MRRITVLRAGVVAAVAALVTLGFAAPVSAHVTVSAQSAVQGGYTKVTFRVPTEKDAATVKVEVVLPDNQPIASVSVKPLPGWTATSQKTKLATPIKSDDGDITEAITKITWTADPASVINSGQFQEFDVSMGPLPKVDKLVFKALQYYSDGEIVRWIEEPTGGTESEHPAPVLKLAKTTDTTNAANDANAVANSTTASNGDGTAVGLGVAGLVLGLAGLVVGLLAYRKAATKTAG
jgi:periplasmic copper chaperone A